MWRTTRPASVSAPVHLFQAFPLDGSEERCNLQVGSADDLLYLVESASVDILYLPGGLLDHRRDLLHLVRGEFELTGQVGQYVAGHLLLCGRTEEGPVRQAVPDGAAGYQAHDEDRYQVDNSFVPIEGIHWREAARTTALGRVHRSVVTRLSCQYVPPTANAIRTDANARPWRNRCNMPAISGSDRGARQAARTRLSTRNGTSVGAACGLAAAAARMRRSN